MSPTSARGSRTWRRWQHSTSRCSASCIGCARSNQRWRIYPATLIRENRWRAQRYGAEGKLIDHGQQKAVPVSDLIEELIDLVSGDATALGCAGELEGLRRILADGTSAHRQRQAYAAARAAGEDHADALCRVVDTLIAEFLAE